MTMKDKLDKLLTDNDIIGNQELYEELVNDLEVLEILRNHIKYDRKNHCIKMKTFYKSTLNFDYEDIKEWLK